jgi:hypothetical protein
MMLEMLRGNPEPVCKSAAHGLRGGSGGLGDEPRCRMMFRTHLLRQWTAVAAAVVGAALVLGHSAAAQPAEQLRYKVTHSLYGDIGTYTNTVEKSGDVTTIKTSVHFKVTMLGVVLHREDAERVERWQGSRLVYFDGTTEKNGTATEVKGQAQGNAFVIQTPSGIVRAPPTIHPANPWSAVSLSTNTMMRVDSGKVEQVKVSGGEETDVKIDGVTIPARKYRIDGSTNYKVWIDSHDVPVKFTVDDSSGEVTFVLEK